MLLSGMIYKFQRKDNILVSLPRLQDEEEEEEEEEREK